MGSRSSQREARMLRFISGDEIRAILTYPECIRVIRETMQRVSAGEAVTPLRTAMPIPGSRNMFGMMPGFLGGNTPVSGIKLLSLYPDNPQFGFPSHMGLSILFDAENGRPLAVMDANQLTAIRTAAATAVATDALARTDAETLLIMGTGEQAETHIRALSHVRSFREIRIWGRDRSKADALCKQMKTEIDSEFLAVAEPDQAVSGADVIATVTASPTPILMDRYLEPGMHINAVGASHKAVMELEPDILARSRFFVDLAESARDQAGEMLRAIETGIVSAETDIDEIGSVLSGAISGRTSAEDITVYKSLGIAAQDLAAMSFILDQAEQSGLGTEVWI